MQKIPQLKAEIIKAIGNDYLPVPEILEKCTPSEAERLKRAIHTYAWNGFLNRKKVGKSTYYGLNAEAKKILEDIESYEIKPIGSNDKQLATQTPAKTSKKKAKPPVKPYRDDGIKVNISTIANSFADHATKLIDQNAELIESLKKIRHIIDTLLEQTEGK